MEAKKRISGLPEMVAALPEEERERFERIFLVDSSIGRLKTNPAMEEWIKKYFGSLDAVREQKVIRITNLVTMEGSFFNELRSKRPVVTEKGEELEQIIEEDRGDVFCRPLELTSEDTFGRIQGQHSISASNIAKFDGFSGVIVFNEHNPLRFTAGRIADYIDTALAWLHKAHETDPEATYPFFLWNCLWRAGASIIHGHAQVILGRGLHYGKVEGLRRAALAYQQTSGSNYFDDLYRVHDSLGLSLEAGGTRVLSYLSPIKDREVLLISSAIDDSLKGAVYQVLDCYVRDMGVRSFNVAILMPPFSTTPEDWSGFPVVVKIVDRGDPLSRTVDMAAMELYASSVLFADPFQVMEVLKEGFRR